VLRRNGGSGARDYDSNSRRGRSPARCSAWEHALTCLPLLPATPQLQAQLRAQLLAQLQPGARAAPGALLVAAPARDQFALPTSLTQQQQQQQRPSRNGTRLWRAAMDALVADHLAACGRACSLSVFAAEAHLPDHGSSGGGALGRDDLLVLLRLAERHPAVHGELRRLAADEDGAGEPLRVRLAF
jgi:hypothetical protein